MPELPEAETVVRQVRGLLCGKRFGAVRHVRAEIVRAGGVQAVRRRLPGCLVQEVRRRGKRIVIRLDGDLQLVIALGMTGHVAVLPCDQEVAKHTHLRVGLEGEAAELRFRDARRFGGVWLLEGADERAGFARLGVEPLEVDLRGFRRLLACGRQTKALLMDQAVIAGLGNIYCDEALHRAGIHPLTRAGDLAPSRVQRLHRAVQRVLTEAIAANGTTIDSYLTARGERGSFQERLRVYGRDGGACPKCGTLIERIQAAGRSTHFCPRCQPA